MIQRTVLVKFADTTTPEQLQEVVDRFKALKNHLTGIVDLQAGLNILERNKEYQVVLMVRFEDQAALDAYVADAEHQAVAAYIKEVGRVDSIGVDFEL
ncbi:MAG: Dabb family protein [Bacillaceae bacterium]|uniref:Dabb family protein n=1 Tax=Alkalihalobacterium chitinilyticum TaxID=2980103 RepID=A0ABT5VHV6_9BACI|nr:Dabb family protein [Alkalihalobacterium chitinilyticum]MDE5415043.1 Dabb family protein [Alkalihalobacterium chitinilyticum]MEB1808859.1 Dabb family protein [Bacillaceae bacterium]